MSRNRLALAVVIPAVVLLVGVLRARSVESSGGPAVLPALTARAAAARSSFDAFLAAAQTVASRARDGSPEQAGDDLPERWRKHLEGAGVIRSGAYADWSERPAEPSLFPGGSEAAWCIVARGIRTSLLVRTASATDGSFGAASFDLELGGAGGRRLEGTLSGAAAGSATRWIWSPPQGPAVARFLPGPPASLDAPVTDARGVVRARVVVEEIPPAARGAGRIARARAWAALVFALLTGWAVARRPRGVDGRRFLTIAAATVAAREALAAGRTFEEILPRAIGSPSLYGHGGDAGWLSSPASLAATALAAYLIARALAAWSAGAVERGRRAALALLAGGTLAAIAACAALATSLPRDSRLPVPRIDVGSWPSFLVAASIAFALAAAAELLAGLGAALLRRAGSARAGRITAGIALVPVALLMLLLLETASSHVSEERLRAEFAPLVLEQSSQRRVALAAAVAEAATDPAAEHLLAGETDTDGGFTAFALWSHGDLFHQGLASSLDLYEGSRRRRSHFGFGLPVIGGTGEPSPGDLGPPPLAIVVENFPVGATRERVLHAEADVRAEGGSIVGRVVGHVLDDPGNLPFLPGNAPYLQALGRGAPGSGGGASGDPDYVLFDDEGRVEISTLHRPPAPSAALREAARTGRVVRVDAGDAPYLGLPLADHDRLHVLLSPATTLLDAAADGVRLLLLGLAVVGSVAAGGMLLHTGSPRTLLDLVRSSFYRKLLASVLVASIVPLVVLAVYLKTAIEHRAEENLAESAATVVAAAQRVVEDYYQAFGEEDAGASADRPTDETLSWLRRVVGQEIHLYENGMLAATSQPEVFDSGLLGWRLPGEIDRALVREGQPTYVRAERWGELSLTVAYARVDVRGGPRNAIIAVPLVAEPRETDRAVRRLVEMLLLGTAALVALLAGSSALLARQVAEPVRRLAAASRRIAGGDYATRLASGSRDEMGSLVSDFNQMGQALSDQRADLLRRRDYIEAVLRHATTGVVSTDAAGRVVTINPAAVALLEPPAPGLPRGALFLETLESGPSTRPLAAALTGRESAGGEPVEVDLGPAERPRRLRVVRVPLPDPAGGETGALVLLDDVTSLMKSNQLAAWAEMARAIAHEIKNPLTPIQLSVEHARRLLADRGALPSPEIESCLDTIVRQVRELREISSAFSTYARLPDLAVEPIDPATFLREVTAPYRTSPPPGVVVEERHSGAPVILGDRRALARAVVNLIENALQAMARGGRLEVASERGESGGAVLTVTDTGPGVAPEARARLFEPYFSTKSAGTGLGLAIARRVVEAHGGTIAVDSARGSGSRFSIRIPEAPRS